MNKYNFNKGITVICCTNKKNSIKNILSNFLSQKYKAKELVIILNYDYPNLNSWRKKIKNYNNIHLFSLNSKYTLGECLNFGVEKARYPIIAKFDDDDYYGPEYLSEGIKALNDTDAALVGKYTTYVYFTEEKILALRNINRENQYVKRVEGPTLLFKKEIFRKIKFQPKNLGEDISFCEDCIKNNFKIFSTSRNNFVYIRNKEKFHTWKINNKSYLEQCIKICQTDSFKNFILKNHNKKINEEIQHTKNYKKSLQNKAIKKIISNIKKTPQKILFMPTNGSGLGHVTRCLAIARRLKKIYPNVEIIFFTTSFAINVIKEEGFLVYYFPSPNLLPKYIGNKTLDSIMEKQLTEIIKRHNIDTIVFDGVFPYSYLINVILKTKFLNPIWVQRGMHKKGKSKLIIDREKFFNLIIIPGEADRKYLQYKNNNFKYCPPIIYSQRNELLSREIVLKMWNLDPNKKTVYIQLGEGLYNDVNSLISKVVNLLKDEKNLQVVVGESIIAHKPYKIDPNIFTIRNYPNSIYFNAFDFAIITGSYNTFHETIYFGLPTIIFPVKETGTDDHLKRAKIVTKLKTGFVITDFQSQKFKNAVNKILDPEINKRMRENTKNIFENGAILAAKYIMQR